MPALPDGYRLLHVGPPKTGTTSLQSAFHRNRDALEALGVHYAGRTTQVRSAAHLMAFGGPVLGLPASTTGEWAELVREVRRSDARHVVASSETFAHCSAEQAEQVLAAFGAERTQVVITARPLAEMLPSAWQQYVQGGQGMGWGPWLRSVLLGEGRRVTPGFWRRTRFDHLAERWARVAGPDHVTVISLAARPRDFVLRSLESMLALPDGVLVPGDDAANTSLPHPLVEMLRQFNRRWARGPDARPEVRARIVEFGAVAGLRASGQQLSRVPTRVPGWAIERANEIAAEMNEGLRALGVKVVGDLDALAAAGPAAEAGAPPDVVPTAEAGALLYTMVEAARREAVRDSDLDWLGTADLVRLARRRLAQRAGSAAGAARAVRRLLARG